MCSEVIATEVSSIIRVLAMGLPAITSRMDCKCGVPSTFFRSFAKASIAKLAFFFFSKRLSESRVGRFLSFPIFVQLTEMRNQRNLRRNLEERKGGRRKGRGFGRDDRETNTYEVICMMSGSLLSTLVASYAAKFTPG